MKAVKLLPKDKTRFHFGRGVEGIKADFASDQLFSALINNYANLYLGEVKDIIADFQTGDVEISSLFYGLNFQPVDRKDSPEKNIYFLPKPILNYKFGDDAQKYKKFKQADYISENLFEKIAKSWNKRDKEIKADNFEIQFLGSKFIMEKGELEILNINEKRLPDINLISTSSRPRVKIDRWLTEEERDTFFQEYLQINEEKLGNYLLKPFHYFMIKGDIDKRLKASIKVMAEEGLGGKRSVGFGSYRDCKIEDYSLPKIPSDYYLTLSSVIPKKEELDNLGNYKLEERSGYIYAKRGRSIKKEKMRVIASGSLLNDRIKGKIVEVSPKGFEDRIEHPVYLNGRSFLLNFGGEDIGS